MKAVIQRVSDASVTIDGEVKASIGRGFLILLGVADGDDEAACDVLSAKIPKLRVFEDDAGKMNLSLDDIGGEVLIVSNFTLCADCRRGNRPDFFGAARPDSAIPLYERFVENIRGAIGSDKVGTGEFGADMKLALTNDGPVTLVIDHEQLTAPKKAAKKADEQ
nr:D-tyrosyl-tRNA(Tyr) deacylase [Clostridia bacterium]